MEPWEKLGLESPDQFNMLVDRGMIEAPTASINAQNPQIVQDEADAMAAAQMDQGRQAEDQYNAMLAGRAAEEQFANDAMMNQADLVDPRSMQFQSDQDAASYYMNQFLPDQSGYNLAKQAIKNEAELIKLDQAKQAEVINQQNKTIEDITKEQEMAEMRRQQEIFDRSQEIDNAAKEIGSQKIDANRFWANKSTGDKILAGISLFLGGFAQGAFGAPNNALQIINRAIDRDIDEQKANFSAKREALADKRSVYRDMFERFKDQDQARAASKIAAIEQAKNQIMEQTAKTRSANAINEANKLIGQLDIQKEAELNNMRLAFGKQLATKKNDELIVEGFGVARTREDAKEVKTAIEEKAKFDRQLGEMIDLRTKRGAEVWETEDVERGKQLSKDLLLTYKNLAKLGVLSVSDENIINQIIPEDPLNFNFSSFAGKDPTMARLKALKTDTDKDFQTKLRTRLRGGSQTFKPIEQQQKEAGMTRPKGSLKQ